MTMQRSILLLAAFILASFNGFAQLAGTTWAIGGPGGQYFFDFIFQEDGVLSANVGGIIQPVATYVINGDTLTTVQSDPDDECTTPGVYTFEIVGDQLLFTLVSDACSDRTFIFTMCTWTQALSTSIQDTKGSSMILIQPNPSSGLVWVEVPGSDHMRISIHLLSGALVHEASFTGPVAAVDLRHLPPAIYLVRTTTEQGTSTDRLVIE